MELETSYLIQIIKGMLHEEENTCELVFPEEFDFRKLFQIANHNGISNMAAFSISKNNNIPDEIRNLFEKQRFAIISQQVNCKKVMSELIEILEEANVKGIVLKGMILKDYYPNPFMRSMSDIDVYAEQEEIEKLGDLMARHGFSEGVIGRANHYEYIKYGVAKIEFHPELVALSSAYGRMVYSKKGYSTVSIARKMDLWSYTEPFEGNSYALKLKPEQHYLYVIMHMMNHFLTAGTGIRSVIDVWIMNKHFGDKWDRKVIDDSLEEFGLLKFERYAVALADKWFTLQDDLNINIHVDENVLISFEKYILNSGTYGNINNLTNRQLRFNANGFSKVSLLMRKVFPPYEHMRIAYSVVDKKPFLLPVMWIYRIFDVLVIRKTKPNSRVRAIINVNEDDAKAQQDLFSYLI